MLSKTENITLSKIKANTGQIVGLPKNPRLIKDDRYKKLLQSIKDDPEMLELRELIVFPANGHFITIAGNMRLRALQELGYKEAPCKVLDKKTPVSKLKAYTIKDNLPYGEIDWDILVSDWQEDIDLIKEWGLELPVDFGQKLEAQEDDYEIPDEIKTDIVLGDLFEIGQHRLLCGSSIISTDVDKLLNGKEPYLMVTDPPYGVNYDPTWRVKAGVSSTVVNSGAVQNDDRADWTEAWSLSPSKVAYIWHGGKYAGLVADNLQKCDFEIRSQIIWNKDQMVFSRGDYHWKHEPCWYAVKKGNKGNWGGDRKQTTVWDIPTLTSFKNGVGQAEWGMTGHGTQKPVECMRRGIQNHDGDVYDPFLGSGTTMVASHQLNRKCYGMEIDPKYCQVIINRMRKLDPDIEIKKNGVKWQGN